MSNPTYSRGDVDAQGEKILEGLPAPCTHCGGVGVKKSKWISYQSDKSGMRSQKRLLHYWQCELCLAQGGASEYEDQALLNWNARPNAVWVPLPEWTASFLLPPHQQYTHLMVHERGEVTFVEYVEEARNPAGEWGPEGVISQVDANLGKYRICILRPPMQIQRRGGSHERSEEGGAEPTLEQGSSQAGEAQAET